MSKCETINVTTEDDVECVINAEDFDKKIHTKVSEKKKVADKKDDKK